MILFVVGFLGVVLFAMLRFFEEKRGQRFFADARNKLDAITTNAYRTVVVGELPHGYRVRLSQIAHNAVHAVVVFAASTLRHIERSLSRVSHRMRSTRAKNGNARDPSPFLKTITPEKKNGSDGTTPPSEV